MPSKDQEADFAKAYKGLSEAEKTAATLEAQLSSLEQKLDDFLAEHDKLEGSGETVKGGGTLSGVPKSDNDVGKNKNSRV